MTPPSILTKQTTNSPTHCPGGWLTRPMVRETLGASEKQMRRWIATGQLKSGKLNNGGWRLFSVEAVQDLRNRINDGSISDPDDLAEIDPYANNPTFSGEEATHVFGMIGEGITLAQIQIRTQLHPYVLRAIKKEFDYLEESITIPKVILDQMNRVSLPGNYPLKNATDILNVMKAAEQDRLCPECKKRPSCDQCAICIRERFAPPPPPPMPKAPPAPPAMPRAPAPPPPATDKRIQPEREEQVEPAQLDRTGT